MEDKELVIDLNLPLGQEACELYRKRMMIVYDVANKLPDYCSVVVMDHGIVIRTIESARKRREDFLSCVEFIKEKFIEYLDKQEKDTI